MLMRPLPAQNALQNLLPHFFHALCRIHRIQQPQPLVVRDQGRSLLLVRGQTRRYDFFAVIRPLNQFAAVVIALPCNLWRIIVNIVNLAANLAEPAAPRGRSVRRGAFFRALQRCADESP